MMSLSGGKPAGQESNVFRPGEFGQSPPRNDDWIGGPALRRDSNPLKSPHAWSGYHKTPASTATPRSEAFHAAGASWLGDLANPPPTEPGAGPAGLYSDGGLFDMAGGGEGGESMRFDFGMLSEPPIGLRRRPTTHGKPCPAVSYRAAGRGRFAQARPHHAPVDE